MSISRLGDLSSPAYFDQLEQIGKEQERQLQSLSHPSPKPSPGDASSEASEDQPTARSVEARLERLERAGREAIAQLQALQLENQLLSRALQSVGIDPAALGLTGFGSSTSGDLSGFGSPSLSSAPLDPSSEWREADPSPASSPANPLDATTPEAFLERLTQLAASPEAFSRWVKATFGDVDPRLEDMGRRMILGSAATGDWSWIQDAAARVGDQSRVTAATSSENRSANAPGGSSGGEPETYAGLAANKRRINAALDQNGATPEERAIVMAMGMQETTTLSAADRDRSKDGGLAQNVSAFNLSADLVRKCGYTGSLEALNDPANTGTVVKLMLDGMRTMGTDNFLNFVRGGSTAFQDGSSYGAGEYRSSIHQKAEEIMNRPELLTNDERAANDLAHV